MPVGCVIRGCTSAGAIAFHRYLFFVYFIKNSHFTGIYLFIVYFTKNSHFTGIYFFLIYFTKNKHCFLPRFSRWANGETMFPQQKSY